MKIVVEYTSIQCRIKISLFYGDLVYKFKKIMCSTDFSDQFRKIIIRHKRISCNLNVVRQSACLVINPITLITLLHSLIARSQTL